MFVYVFSVILSLLFIFGFHMGFQYIKNTCTVKKNKDIHKYQNEKYEQILRKLSQTPSPIDKPNDLTPEDTGQLDMDLDEFVRSLDTTLPTTP